MLAALFVSVLLAIGWRDKYLSAVQSANMNAGYWAQAESEKHDAEINVANLKGAQQVMRGHYNQMSQIAREAIRMREHQVDMPSSLRLDSEDDSILDERDIDC